MKNESKENDIQYFAMLSSSTILYFHAGKEAVNDLSLMACDFNGVKQL